MLKSILTFFGIEGDPVEIGASLFRVITEGTFAKASKHKLVLDGGDDGRFVFKGKFDLEAGEVTGGTIKGYTAFANGEKLMKASDIRIDFTELKDGLEDGDAAVRLLLSADRAFGSRDDDAILAIAKRIKAGDGDDFIVGQFVNKRIYGEDGDDTIIGGTGSDILFGGQGRDLFVFRGVSDAVDEIRDFKAGRDKIVFDSSDFDALGEVVDAAEFVVGTEATTADHHIIYDDETGAVYWDGDGVGGDGKVQLAVLDTGLKLTAAHFTVESIL